MDPQASHTVSVKAPLNKLRFRLQRGNGFHSDLGLSGFSICPSVCLYSTHGPVWCFCLFPAVSSGESGFILTLVYLVFLSGDISLDLVVTQRLIASPPFK